jgi:hypothetical protein
MASVGQLLRDLFLPEQLQALDMVRGEMLMDPTIFDNHSREKRNGEEVQDPHGEVGG